MTRRGFLAATAGGLASVETAGKTNLVVIFADDLGYGDLGCYGSTKVRTPHIDAMARGGVRFTDFYAGAPFCSPSRASLLTGRYPVRAGVPNVLFPTETTGLPPSEITIARMLKTQGYATACIGKWHLGVPAPFRAHRHGFDSFYGLPYSNDMFPQREGEPFRAQHARAEIPLMENDRIVEAPVDQHTLTQRYTDRAVRFLESNRERPFFLYLPHTFPHSPQYASKEFEGRSPHGFYPDTVEELDASVGRILDTLRRLELDRKTMVVFTSDNGPAPGRPDGAVRWRGGSAGLLRGGKGNTYEGGVRVPGIFWQPGTIPSGRATKEVASILDLFPTAAQLAGTKPPGDRPLDGLSLVDFLHGKNKTIAGDRLFCYYFGEQLQAVRRGRWKLVLEIRDYPRRPPSLWYKTMPALFERHYRLQPKPELYDLLADPAEKNNLAAEQPDIIRELTQAAAAYDRELQAHKTEMVFLKD